MNYTRPLISATLIQRYKRFLADAELQNGAVITAHVANPGSMLGLKDKGVKIWLEPNDDPKRKLKYTWRLAELPNGALVGVDTGLANKIVKEALSANAIPDLPAENFRSEVKYGESSRVDFLLSNADLPDCYVEVKSVTLSRQPGLAEFPDSVTARGAKHMAELAAMVKRGHRAVLLYLVQRNDAKSVAIAADIDPAYHAAFIAARKVGVEVMCYATDLSPEGITLSQTLPLANNGLSD